MRIAVKERGMVLRDCKKGMLHWPEGDRNIPVLVETNGEEISLKTDDLYRKLIFTIYKGEWWLRFPRL